MNGRGNIFSRLLAFSAILLAASGCGNPQPLLTMIQQDYLPIETVNYWFYTAVNGGTSFSRTRSIEMDWEGRYSYTMTLSTAQTGPAGRFSGSVAPDGDGLYIWDTTPGLWRLDRKLPYILLSEWPLETATGEDSKIFKVGGIENVQTAVIDFERCYRLEEVTTVGLAASTNIVWVAPGVGDVQYGHLSQNAEVIIDHVLAVYLSAP